MVKAADGACGLGGDAISIGQTGGETLEAETCGELAQVSKAFF